MAKRDVALLSLCSLPWRRPINIWEQELLVKLASLQIDTVGGESTDLRLAECFNQAALVELLRGNYDNAHYLCELHLVLHKRIWTRHQTPHSVKLATQPWVNLQRLAALRGDGGSTRIAFANLYEASDKAAVSLGCWVISGSLWQDLRNNCDFSNYLTSVYVCDTLKSLVRDKEWDQIVHFASVSKFIYSLDDAAALALDEANLLALEAQGHVKNALRRATEGASHGGIGAEALFKYYQARFTRSGTKHQKRVQLLEDAAQWCADRFGSRGPFPFDVALLLSIARMSQRADDSQLAFETALVAHAAATVVADEVFVTQSKKILALTAPTEADRQYWSRAAQEATCNTEYFQLMSEVRRVSLHSTSNSKLTQDCANLISNIIAL